MKLLISIPNEFEQHFRTDRFEDSLHRLSADAHLLAGNYEQETAIMLIEAFKKAVSVPPHGDLIDRREAIIDANERAYDFWLSDDEVNATIQFLNEQTTIIPAEEGNSNVE